MSGENGGINPNVEVSSEVPVTGQIEVPAGESFTSFEALDKIFEQAKQSKKEASKAANSKQEKAASEPPKEETSIKTSSSEKEVVAKPEEKSGKEETPLKNAPTDETSLVEVTVDGKKEQVSLKDLKNHYSGKVAWDKKFTELDKERKSYLSEKQAIEQTWNSFVEKSAKDPKSAIIELCQMTNVDSVAFVKNLRNAMLPEIKKLASMSDSERRAYEAEEELSLLKQARESEVEKRTREQEVSSLSERVSGLQETFKIDQNTTKRYYEELRQTITDRPVTIEDLEIYAGLNRDLSRVSSALEQIRPDLLSNNSIMMQLVNSVNSNPELDDNDIKDIIEQTFGKSKSSKVLKSKVEKAAKAEGVPVKADIKPQTKNPNSDPISFSDLE